MLRLTVVCLVLGGGFLWVNESAHWIDWQSVSSKIHHPNRHPAVTRHKPRTPPATDAQIQKFLLTCIHSLRRQGIDDQMARETCAGTLAEWEARDGLGVIKANAQRLGAQKMPTPKAKARLEAELKLQNDIPISPSNPYRFEGNYSGWPLKEAASAHLSFLHEQREWEQKHAGQQQRLKSPRRPEPLLEMHGPIVSDKMAGCIASRLGVDSATASQLALAGWRYYNAEQILGPGAGPSRSGLSQSEYQILTAAGAACIADH